MSDRAGLQPLAELCAAEIRNTCYVRINIETSEEQPITLEDHYATQYLNHRLPNKTLTRPNKKSSYASN